MSCIIIAPKVFVAQYGTRHDLHYQIYFRLKHIFIKYMIMLDQISQKQRMNKKTFSTTFAGKPLIAEFSDLAENAHGSVILKYEESAVLVTAVMSKNPKEGGDFFPLTVDYEERFYAAGKILGSQYVRREGRPSEEAILSGRIIDRTIRPLFDGRMRHEVQCVATVLAIDTIETDILAVNAASLALCVSEIPWGGPVGAVRISRKDNNWIIMPPFRTEEGKDIEYDATLTLCGKDGAINMIEMEGKELSEELLMEAMSIGSKEISALEEFQKKIISEIGKQKRVIELKEVTQEIKDLFKDKILPKFEKTIFAGVAGRKLEYELMEEWMAEVALNEDMDKNLAAYYFDEEVNILLHRKAIDENLRPDNRDFDTVRPLYAQAGGVSSIHHGTGVFYRGGTHILSVLTLGGPNESQLLEGMEVNGKRTYMHHYNFPPYSSGEVGRVGNTNRRAIGHGALAEKALIPVLPKQDVFPYTIRIVSEALASNGSTSMGSVCGSSLALMDAGVPITKPVAGIASGLMMDTHEKYKVLTDIQGPEDHHGDMDFKVAGTKDGVTAVQMDVKVDGIPLHILSEAFAKAKAARLHILETMNAAISAPRNDINKRAPKIMVLKIDPDQIGGVIGSGGKVVKEIRDKTGADIDIEDDGTVYVTGRNGSAEKAYEWISDLTKKWTKGMECEGEVVRITDFGAFVKLSRAVDGMVHVSEIAPWRVERPSDILTLGEIVPVTVIEVDEERGRIGLSIKARDAHRYDSKKPVVVHKPPVTPVDPNKKSETKETEKHI